LLAERISATRARRDDDLAHRRAPLTGVSEFPDLAEPLLAPAPAGRAPGAAGPFAARRYAQPYERLRDRSDAHLAATGARPQVFLATIGTTARFTPRATFAANLLAAGGIAAAVAGEHADEAALAAAFRDSGARIACLCGTDADYREHGAAVVAALRGAGAAEVLAAGPEAAFDGGVRPDGFLTQGIDAVEVLTGLLDRAGVE
jgi:methylmalonyl-CoA mutase